MLVAEADHRLDVRRRGGEHDELGQRAVPGQRVALVGPQLLGLRDHVLAPERGAQLVGDPGRQAHAVMLDRLAA